MSERRSLKRKSDWSTTDLNEKSKRFKDNNKKAHRINPNNPFEQKNTNNLDPFHNYDNQISNNDNSSNKEENELDGLLYKLSRLDVGDHQSQNRCPVCSKLIPLETFAPHVYKCLDSIGESARNSIEKQIEADENYALSLTSGYGSSYQSDATVECPMCHKIFHVGDGINVHVNRCIDDSNNNDIVIENNDDDNDINLFSNIQENNNNNNNNQKVKKLNKSQMAAVASHILSEQKGSKEYDKMLEMFSCLGFKKKNMTKIVQQGKDKPNKFGNPMWNDNNNNMNNNNNNNNNSNYNNRMKSPPNMQKKKRPMSPDLMIAKNKLNESRMSQSPPPRSNSVPLKEPKSPNKIDSQIEIDDNDL